MLFEWDEKYSVGIQSIDVQHKEIFRILDQLFQALKLGKASESIIQIITELEIYAVSHFQREEFFFRQFNYESSDPHIKEHQDFTAKIISLKADAKAGKLTSSFDLLHYLKIWIDHHILNIDILYSELFREKGLR